MPTDAPAVVDQYFERLLSGDVEGLLALFTDNATVIDEGRTWHGIGKIREWRTGVASKWEYTTTITGGASTGDDSYRVTARLDGNFPGNTVDLNFDFTLENDRISRLEIAV